MCKNGGGGVTERSWSYDDLPKTTFIQAVHLVTDVGAWLPVAMDQIRSEDPNVPFF